MSLSPDVPQVEPADAAQLVADGAFLLDVREDDEWEAGHAAAATHVRLSEIPSRVDEVPGDRTVIAICRAGGRSQQAAEFLRAQGIDAVNMAGGMWAWAAADLDVVTGSGEAGAVI